MIYLKRSGLIIRSMRECDAKALAGGFAAQGWNKPESQFLRYFSEQESGARQVFIAECEGGTAGYVTLLPEARCGPFYGLGIPELCDFNVLIKYRRRGIGSALMDAAESAALERCDRISLGVGLYADYGAAQRLYVLRGYVPDGSGVWHGSTQVAPYEMCRNDDDLVLYMLKKLKK